MTRENIIQAVKVKLEELSPFDDGLMLLTNNAEKPIISYIGAILEEASDEVLMLLPLYMINPHQIPLPTQLLISDNVGQVTLPGDFLRLHTIKHVNWSQAVHTAIKAEHPDYNLQKNPYTRGKYINPVVVVDDTAGGKKLLLYSIPSTVPTLETALYVPKQQKILTGDYCSDIIAPYVIQLAAIKISGIYGRAENFKLLQEEFNNKLQLLTN